ncbi:MAG: DUF6596 domain-containing protein, partial [Cyclobacteriaceae bacterium]
NALFALMCFHTARLETKTDENGRIIELKSQNRRRWYAPLILMGNNAMNRAVHSGVYSTYHYEAAIASEHLISKSFEATDWDRILMWYERLLAIQPSVFTRLNIATVQIQRKNYAEAESILLKIDPSDLQQRAYLYYGARAELYSATKKDKEALASLEAAINLVSNEAEKEYLLSKKEALTRHT